MFRAPQQTGESEMRLNTLESHATGKYNVFKIPGFFINTPRRR